MISKSRASEIADEVIDAGRRDRAWRNGLTRPLPHWFKGAHLAGLSDHERHARFDEMSRRALRRPGWLLVALAVVGGFLLAAVWFPRFPVFMLTTCPAAIVMVARHYALRSEFKRDVRAFVSGDDRVNASQ